MELIRLDGYTEDEKVAIARDHLLRRQIEQAGLPPDEVTVTDEAILAVITTTPARRACGTSSASSGR